MKRLFIPLTAVFMAAISLCTSCLGDEKDDVVFPHTATITSASLGTLKRIIHIQTRDGRDSTYTVNLTGSYFPLHIDQISGKIYNTDSLPLGTDLTHVTFNTLSHTGTAICIDAETTESDTIFSSSDSTDFSRPRLISVYNPYGEKRTYRMELNCHKEEGDTFIWRKCCTGRAELAAATRLKAFIRNEQVILFAEKNGRIAMFTASKETPWVLEQQTIDSQESPETDNIVMQNGVFYGLRDGSLLKSTDGRHWETVLPHAGLKILAGSGTKHLVGLTETDFRISEDNGLTWKTDEADEPGMIPESDIVYTHTASRLDPTFEEIVIVGRKGTENAVWRKNVDLTGSRNYAWNYLPAPESTEDFACPLLDSPSLISYDNGALLTGLEPGTGTVAAPRMSRENGRTWRTNDIKNIPATGTATCLATATDGTDIYVFIGGTGDVWTGRFNRLGWQWSQADNYVYKATKR